MGDSVANVPVSSEAQDDGGLRASDADRDEVVTRLKSEYAAGRLSHDTFLHRMDGVLATRRQSDLPAFVADLPAPAASPPGRVPAALRALTGWVRTAVRPSGGTAARRPGADSGESPGQPSPRLTSGMRLTSGIPGYFPLPLGGPRQLPFPRGDARSFSIGRDSGCDLAIGDMSVSRLHARLLRTDDGWLLADLGSTNGTRVNGWRVTDPVAVRPGDVVSFGNVEYSLTSPDAP